VLDASALIAVLRCEPGADTVRKHLSDAVVSAVNYSEILKKTIERGGSSDLAQAFLRNLSLRIIPFDAEQAVASAALYPQTKPYGLSFADRACLSLGILHRLPVLTTEQAMGQVDVPIKIRVSLSFSDSKVSRLLALLKLPAEIIKQVEAGKIPPSGAYELARVTDAEQQASLAQQMAAGQLTRDAAAGARKAATAADSCGRYRPLANGRGGKLDRRGLPVGWSARKYSQEEITYGVDLQASQGQERTLHDSVR
jgi:PIN domain nuclease of toxin-antitoxin system